jgi:hypothetical protein
MVRKVLEPFSFCPFFDMCENQIDWFYVTEVCFAKHKTCNTYAEMVKKERRIPKKWTDRVYSVYSSLGLDDYYIFSERRVCPFFFECEAETTFEDIENLCADKFTTCDFYMKQAKEKKLPVCWRDALRLMLEPFDDEEEDDDW